MHRFLQRSEAKRLVLNSKSRVPNIINSGVLMTMTRTQSRRTTGNVLIEGVICCALSILIMFFGIEMVRSAQQFVLLRHGCFLYTRYRALGVSESRAQGKVASFVRNALGSAASHWLEILKWDFNSLNLSGRLSSRYRSLFLPFRDESIAGSGTGLNDRLMFTKRCYFSSKAR